MATPASHKLFSALNCRSNPDFSAPPPSFNRRLNSAAFYGPSALILRFPPNFHRQLSTKARRNCSNIGVAQIVAASWSNAPAADSSGGSVPAASAVDAAAMSAAISAEVAADDNVSAVAAGNGAVPVQFDGSVDSSSYSSFLKSDGSMAIHAAERLGRGIVTDAITTPVVNTSAYFFKKTADLIDFKEKRQFSFEYGRYGNPTTIVLEEKLRKTRIFIETVLPKMGITASVIDPADVGALESALEENNVSLFFTESPTNPFLRCVDIKLVSEICHRKGVLVCIDGTFATPLNQKALALGADLVLSSATKYIGGHNDVLGGYISGPDKLVSQVRTLHHVLGGTLNPNAAYLFIRGLKTLHLRVQQQNSTALRMANILEGHPKVKRVYYPGLPSHPEHQLAMRQMTGFGGVVSFEIDGDLLTTIKFVDALKIPYIAPSFGGCESIVDQPAIMSYWDLPQSERVKYGINDNLVRFSFGVEDFEDLKADVLQALEAI
ncbi:cAMP-dependent protein kinase regulatory subunit Cgs1 [Stylosanthes scabra]|uniref:cAMP-dependent protein kinase regulatory subunit Cgs1 n=1 Tax=Stylosanthes scabra TaxID=79078 RepID=A0ABU6S5X4_9FABA|nr:cAMP-dependent protein kinase regulatory subunit Cgs1 [Stylosanthes scabra]